MKLLTNKQIKQAILRIATNHIIAVDTLHRISNKMSFQQYSDTVQHLTDNSIESARIIGGLKGINMLNKIVEKKICTMSSQYVKK